MSDRCPTNDKIERILEEKLGHKLNQFKCAVHPLDTMARTVRRCQKCWKLRMRNRKDLYIGRSESVTQGVVRGVGKLWYSDKIGLI